MYICERPEDWPISQGSVITIGNFDGLHLGHQKLIEKLVFKAKTLNLEPFVVTFDPHPQEILAKSDFPRMFSLQSLELKLLQTGVKAIIVQNFDESFSKLGAEAFFSEYIVPRLQPKELVLGYDFKMGARGHGDITFLTHLCQKMKMGLEVVSAFEDERGIVSSSRVRKDLQQGEMALAKHTLGHWYFFEGIVIEGRKLGRTIQVPTANLAADTQFCPRKGVYASEVIHKGKKYFGVTNVGLNPTVSESQRVKIETHLFQFSGDLYGERIQVYLKKFLRDEKKFSSTDELKQQIHADIALAQQWSSL